MHGSALNPDIVLTPSVHNEKLLSNNNNDNNTFNNNANNKSSNNTNKFPLFLHDMLKYPKAYGLPPDSLQRKSQVTTLSPLAMAQSARNQTTLTPLQQLVANLVHIPAQTRYIVFIVGLNMLHNMNQVQLLMLHALPSAMDLTLLDALIEGVFFFSHFPIYLNLFPIFPIFYPFHHLLVLCTYLFIPTTKSTKSTTTTN